LAELAGILGQHCVEEQGRQGEIVDHLGFVIAAAEIRDIFSVGDVGFGDHDGLRSNFVQNEAHQLDDAVGFFKVDAGCTDFLPQIGDGIKADGGCAVRHIG
jgi:hypothetical protein